MASVNVLVCSYLESELVERIRTVDPQVNVYYDPGLIPQPRYPADHIGFPLKRSSEEQKQWETWLRQAEILFDFDYTGIQQLPERAPNVRWIQATSAGIGQFVQRHKLNRMDTIFTTASGVHARPLAEFVLVSMLEIVKRTARAQNQQHAHHWQKFSIDELGGKTLAVIGLGKIGREVAKLAKICGLNVIGIKRHTEGVAPQTLGIDQLYPRTELHPLLARADFICLACPHTPETEGMIGQAEFDVMKPDATLINIARGAVVDEPELINALNSGHLAHAILDVMAEEPLPKDNPLWDMTQVIIYPHTASTSVKENQRLTDLFCENLRRHIDRQSLVNVFDTERMY